MAINGSDPMFFFDAVGDSISPMIGGGDPTAIAVMTLAMLVFLVLYFKLDRGAMALLAMLYVGVGVQLRFIPDTVFWAVIFIVATIAAYGILNMMRQGEG